jgi:hypothetical protein
MAVRGVAHFRVCGSAALMHLAQVFTILLFLLRKPRFDLIAKVADSLIDANGCEQYYTPKHYKVEAKQQVSMWFIPPPA